MQRIGIITICLFFAGCGSSGTLPPPAQADKVAAKAPTNSDETATFFLEALRREDYEAATTVFDADVKAGLSPRNLRKVWDDVAGSLGRPTDWSIVQRTEERGMDVRVALLSFERGALFSIISVRPDSQRMSGLWFRPAPADAVNAVRAAAEGPKEHETFWAEPVTVGTSPYELEGTLLVPKGDGPFPAALLVHGSGPHDRDESVGANKPFRDLAEGLAARGVAVLRYNKRTFQHAGKLSNDITVDDEVVLDAVSAIKLLQSHAKVDRTRLFVIGHSLGAGLAPEIALRAAPVAGAVLLAPPGRAPWEIVLAQMRFLAVPEAELAKVQKDVDHLVASGLRDGQLLGVPAEYWRDLAGRDSIGFARRLQLPILILRGDRDYQVEDADLTVWREGLAGEKNVAIETVKGVNHLFIPGTGPLGPAEYGREGHVAPQVIERVAQFVKTNRSAPSP